MARQERHAHTDREREREIEIEIERERERERERSSESYFNTHKDKDIGSLESTEAAPERELDR